MNEAAQNRWYIRDHFDGQPRQVWEFDGKAAKRLGVTNPEAGPGSYFEALPGENFIDCLKRCTPWLDQDASGGRFFPAALGPAQYYPRIARPLALGIKPSLWYPPSSVDAALIASARSQLTLLVRRLELICQTVQPSAKTLDIYGHEIRNLLILAATEAEAHWRGILNANRPSPSRFNSNEYAKLIEPLGLLDYAVEFHDFPEIGPIFPFAGWDKTDPSKSLGWFDAYNGVKHDRENEFDRGTLRHAFEAVSACIALLVAQFGNVSLSFELSAYFKLQLPNWPLSEMYLSRVTSADWSPIRYPGL